MHWKKSIAAQKDKNYIIIIVRSNNVARDEDANNGDAQVNETLLKTYLVCRYLWKALMNILL